MADQREHDNQTSIGGRGAVDVPGFDQSSVIGTGGSATVYRAHDLRHRRWVALKVLDGQATDERQRRAFDREIQAMGRIGNHPYIVTVLASGFTPTNHPYLVLPLFERGTLAELVDEHGPFTWAEAIDIGIKLCSAVETVHRAGVVHRDIKPGNVFVGVSPAQPLLGDFGISSLIGSERTRTSTMAVTFGYTAPEVLEDERPTVASDIYSLGMTVYRLIQGLPAYHAETPAAVMRKVLDETHQPRLSAGVPAGLAQAVLAMLAGDPADRPDSALTVARHLQQVQADNGLAMTEVMVADEPSVVAQPSPSVPGSPSAPIPQREPPAIAVEEPRTPSPTEEHNEAPLGLTMDRSGDSRSTAHHVASVLAAALNSPLPADTPSPGVQVAVEGSGSTAGSRTTPTSARASTATGGTAARPGTDRPSLDLPTDRPSLDLPTVHEPRVPLRVRQQAENEPAASRRTLTAAAVAVATVVVLVAVLAVAGSLQGWWSF